MEDMAGEASGVFVGTSLAVGTIRESPARVARSTATVLIVGESGTGEEATASSRPHGIAVRPGAAAWGRPSGCRGDRHRDGPGGAAEPHHLGRLRRDRQVVRTTPCGADLRVMKGDAPTDGPDLILALEGVGVTERVGAGVSSFEQDGRVILSCITSRTKCEACKTRMPSHWTTGG